MKEFSKEWFTAVRADINNALAEVGDKYGFDFHTGNASYEQFSFTMKVEAEKRPTADLNPKKIQWDNYATLVNLLPDDFGKTITITGKQFTITGIDKAKSKNCILIQDVAGKGYTTTPDTILRALGRPLGTTGAPDADAGEPSDWETKAFMVGIKGTPYKQRFVVDGAWYEVIDIKCNAPKYPLICRNIKNGHSYAFPIAALNDLSKKKEE